MYEKKSCNGCKIRKRLTVGHLECTCLSNYCTDRLKFCLLSYG